MVLVAAISDGPNWAMEVSDCDLVGTSPKYLVGTWHQRAGKYAAT
jgi:hypothetical protein